MLNAIRDKPPMGPYSTLDRVLVTLGVASLVITALLGCLGPGEGRETYIAHGTEKAVENCREAETRAERRITPAEPELVSLGTYTLYAYCPCERCCGQWSGGPTASGVMPQEGRTVAADWSVLPAGTEIYIDGIGWRVVEDTGAGIDGQALDVYCGSHEAALEFGVREVTVYARQD